MADELKNTKDWYTVYKVCDNPTYSYRWYANSYLETCKRERGAYRCGRGSFEEISGRNQVRTGQA
jgi:hypothetical protein